MTTLQTLGPRLAALAGCGPSTQATLQTHPTESGG